MLSFHLFEPQSLLDHHTVSPKFHSPLSTLRHLLSVFLFVLQRFQANRLIRMLIQFAQIIFFSWICRFISFVALLAYLSTTQAINLLGLHWQTWISKVTPIQLYWWLISHFWSPFKWYQRRTWPAWKVVFCWAHKEIHLTQEHIPESTCHLYHKVQQVDTIPKEWFLF